MTSTPQAAADYIARLVDSRKRAYALDCLACWNQGQPFASEWPNLKAELVADVATKMRRYLKVKSPATAKPNQEVATATHHAHGSPVPSDAMDAIEAHMTAGGELGIGGGYRFATITNAAYRSRTDSGDWYVKAEGPGYRVRQGRKSSVFLFEGQLRWMNCECDAETAKPIQEEPISPVEQWVAETVTTSEEPVTFPEATSTDPLPAAPKARKPRAAKTIIVQPNVEIALGIAPEAEKPQPTRRPRYITGTYGEHGNYSINPNGRWAQAAIKTIGEYESKAAYRWPRQKSKDVSLAGSIAVTPLFTETLGGRKWLDVVAEMNGTLYRGWQAGDPTPDAIREFSAYTSNLHPDDMPHLGWHGEDCREDATVHVPDTYAEAAG